MTTLNDSVYERLWGLIVSGELSPNERLNERILADRLGVSRTPVREAINRLVQHRVVIRSPYRGYFVASLDAKAISDLYTVRQELEGLAVRLAVPQMSDNDIAYCTDLVHLANQALAENDLDKYGDADQKLHDFIVDKASNESLKSCLLSLSREIQLVRNFGNRRPSIAEDAATNRNAFLIALRKRDSSLASELMEKHIDDVRRCMIEEVESQDSQHVLDRGGALD